MNHRHSLIAVLSLASAFASAQISVFSSGLGTPENIALAPSNFGNWGGTLFTPDFRLKKIWSISATSGAATEFASHSPEAEFRNGMFLPSSFLGGGYLATGDELVAGASAYTGVVSVFNSSGQETRLRSGVPLSYNGAIYAQTFGAYSGDVLIGNSNNAFTALHPDGTFTDFGTNVTARPWGLAFAPEKFGSYGGKLFYSSGTDGQIGSLDRSGVGSLFTTLTSNDGLGTQGLRQIAFTPDEWLSPIGVHGTNLLVSIPDSNGVTGTGVHGSIVAIDSQGKVVAALRRGTTASKFDPRGMYFLNDGSMLVSDASDPILKVAPNAFQPVPEPSTLLVLIGGAWLLRRRRTKIASRA